MPLHFLGNIEIFNDVILRENLPRIKGGAIKVNGNQSKGIKLQSFIIY